MEKQLIRWSYLLGILCVAIAVVLRGLNAVGLNFGIGPYSGNPLSYMSFVKGALLLLVTCIATNAYAASGRN